MDPLQLSTLISEEKIQKRIQEMGAQLTDKFRNQEVVAICVLKGAFVFFSDLVREIDIDLTCEFFGISSYQSMESSGEVKLTLDLATPIENKHVLLVEDMADTGHSLHYLQKNLKNRNPKSLTTVTLLRKPEATKAEYKVDYVGFNIANDFVVGYGLDCDETYRNLPYIAQVQNIN